MAEIAIVSSRKSRLSQSANEGNEGSKVALELVNSPTKFLSTVQIGMTFTSIFAGAFGGGTIAFALAASLRQIPLVAPYAPQLAFFLVVAVITYLSLVIGELVPKRLAMNNPEKAANMLAPPMNLVSYITSPIVNLLSVSTDFIIKLLRVKPSSEPTVNDEDVRMLVREGAQLGIFELAEKDIVERTLRLGDKKANILMIPRKEIIWLNSEKTFKDQKQTITKFPHNYFPVCRGNIDRVVGIVRTKDLLTNYLEKEKFDINDFLHKPLLVPVSMNGLDILSQFKKSGIHVAMVIDEYGNIQGLISLKDILEAIVGDIPTIDEIEEQEFLKAEDGSVLVSGLASIEEFKEYFHVKKLPDEKSGMYHTIGGFVMHTLGKVPQPADFFELGNLRVEVVDMDGNRVHKILVISIKKPNQV